MNIHDEVVKEIKEIASFINEDAKSVRLEASNLAKVFEKVFGASSNSINISDMDQRYERNKEMYYLKDFQYDQKGYRQILATGAIPVDDNIKAKLVMLEQLYPKISESYGTSPRIDEVWYIDEQSVAGGKTNKQIMSRIVPGFDVGGEFARGERPYSRFGIIGPENNPDGGPIWSPAPLIEIFEEFVVSAQAPVYFKGKLTGKISIHYNLIFLCNDVLAKSQRNLVLISKPTATNKYTNQAPQFTLIGMSPGAKAITHFPEYRDIYKDADRNIEKWESKKAKMEYLNNEINLEKQNEEFTNTLKTLKSGIPGECEFSGKKYTVYAEDIPDLNFQILALM